MAENLTASNLFFAIAGGFIPSLLWLWFWLKEDGHPEPRSALISTFVAGMIVVPLAMILEYIVSFPIGLTSGLSLLVWAFIEEILKYAAAKKTAFCKSCFDEPVDAIIYMITIALGFSAIENSLFILAPIAGGDTIGALVTGNLRFIGATLLHIISSSAIGAAIALSFYQNAKIKKEFVLIGVILSITLHTIFNLLIIKSSDNGGTFFVFLSVWITIVVLMIIFEKVKSLAIKHY